MIHPDLQFDREQLAEICRRYGVRELCLFGSAVRDDFGPGSDVDVLVEYLPEKHHDMYQLMDFIDELEALFDRPVDIIEGRDLIRNPYRRATIIPALEHLYAA